MRRTPTLAFLLVTVFIDILGLGIIVPIVPSLMTAVTGHPGSAARWSGAIDASYGIAQFLIAPFLGRVADRYGRRPVLIGALAMLGVNFFVHAIAGSPGQLLAAHALAGAFAGTNIVVNAYIADITEPADRPKAYGYIGAAFSIGFVAGPIIGGLLGGVSVRLPFYVAAALALGNAAYGWLILPESRPGDHRTSLSWRVANPAAALLAMLRHGSLRELTIARLLSDIARIANQVMWVYVMTIRFGWSTVRVGLVLAGSAVLGSVVQARLSAPFIGRLGVRRAAIVAALCGAVSLAGYGIVPGNWLIMLPLAVGTIAALGGSATQSWITDISGADEQGTVQGALLSISSLAEGSVPLVATAVFAWSLTFGQPGLVLVLAGVFALASAAVLQRAAAPRVANEPAPVG
jgi:MFS transporter, DHA1 family, tetracycline resistance protein